MTSLRTILAAAAVLLAAQAAVAAPYGSIGSLKAKPGHRAALAALILEGSEAMPGCRSYTVAADQHDPDLLWVTEVWDDKAAHDASLKLPAVRAAITKARPLIAGFGMSADTDVIEKR